MKTLFLQAFAESAAPAGVTAADAGQQNGEAAMEAAPETQGQESAPDPEAEFEKLIHGPYREEFARRVKGIIDRRFARDKRANRQEQEQEQPTAGEPERNAQETAYLALLREADEVRQTYPNLDLAAEAKNPQFVAMLRAGLPVQAAYETAHREELLRGAMQYTAAAVARQVGEGIRGSALRPRENGAAAAPAQSRYNVSGMDRTQRRALIARARAGEKIVL